MENVRKQNLESIKQANTKNIFDKEISDLKQKTSFLIHNILRTPKKNNIETTNLDLAIEKMLAKIFWLSAEKIAKLENDYKEPITLTKIITQAENYWKESKISA